MSALIVATAVVVIPSTPVQAASLGGIDVVPGKGNAQTLISVVTERGCTEPAKRVSAVVFGKGLPDEGQVVVAPSEFLFSSTRPMELPLSNAFVIYAKRNATALQGTYELKVRCTDRIGVTVLDEFSTTMSWRTPGGSLKNIEKASFTAKSTAGVVAAASATPAPAPKSTPGGTAPSTPNPSSSASAATPAPGGAIPDYENPDGSNPGVDDLVAEATAAGATESSQDRSVWFVVGFSAIALLIAAALWFRGRRSTP
jgi:hypothetical protein